MELFKGLNPQQKKAVSITEGPLLIIAGAGSGKTLCLTYRIAYLIRKGVLPQNILAVTFTNKAAGEMKKRVADLIKDINHYKRIPVIGTFHSVCCRILRKEANKIGYRKDFIIYDERDQISLIKRIMKDLHISDEQFKPNSVKSAISYAKDELIDKDNYFNQATEYFTKTVAKIYLEYQNRLKELNALDFDDLIFYTVDIFDRHPDVLKRYQDMWQYILVDEYQDVNTAQYTLVNLLAKRYRNLCVIGDPDQCIYQWRNADFRNILNFERDYPEAKVVVLEQNYRSTQNILDAGHYIIIKNTRRKPKKLWTDNPRGERISVIQVQDEKQEGEFIVNEINSLPFELKDFVVLYRTNAQSRAVEEAFLKANIPYKIIGAVRFYERREIKDILAYLKLIVNPSDWVSMERIINVPPRGIGKITLGKIKNLDEKVKAYTPFLNFNKLMDNLREASKRMPVSKLMEFLIEKINYRNYIDDKTEEGERRWENIKELFTVALRYDSMTPPLGLLRFLEEVSIISSNDEVETEKNLVNLMTLHCAKGLEFPVVFIVGMEEGIFPHSRAMLSQEEMEEERRLCYVGITRAKQKLYIVFARKRNLYGKTAINPPSRFLLDLPKKLVDYQIL
ncbi:UvrD-helicase domain-containing protein [bacterium]|nr:UvrD-helicase domain-containing protein [bacterium]